MTLAELNHSFRVVLPSADAPQTWSAAMAGVLDATYDRTYSDAALRECNRVAALKIPAEVSDRVPSWADLMPLLQAACDANNSTASEAPGYLRSILEKMGTAADATT